VVPARGLQIAVPRRKLNEVHCSNVRSMSKTWFGRKPCEFMTHSEGTMELSSSAGMPELQFTKFYILTWTGRRARCLKRSVRLSLKFFKAKETLVVMMQRLSWFLWRKPEGINRKHGKAWASSKYSDAQTLEYCNHKTTAVLNDGSRSIEVWYRQDNWLQGPFATFNSKPWE
jgi:hypothetical protein